MVIHPGAKYVKPMLNHNKVMGLTRIAQTDGQGDEQTDRQTDRQTGIQTDMQTNMQSDLYIPP